jgi:hypothetical protein
MRKLFWTSRLDTRLLQLHTEGCSASQIAERLGTTRGAIIGRLHRVLGKRFPSDVERAEKSRAMARAEMEARRKVEERVIEQMRKNLNRGMARDQAITRAHAAGARFSALGQFFGLTPQAMHMATKRYLVVRGEVNIPRQSRGLY